MIRTVRKASRKYAILAHGAFSNQHRAKTAHGVIAFGSDPCVVVIDRECAGRSVHDVVPHLSSQAPIVASLAEALALGPTSLLIGIAPPGGILPIEWRSEIVGALEAGLEVVNGLHMTLADDEVCAAAATRGCSSIWDVRTPPPNIPLFSGAAWNTDAQVLLTVGSDCSVGKMTVSLELVRAARDSSVNAGFVPTGQTGIIIAGWGIAIDRVISDFTAGATEQLVLNGAKDHDLLIVEGQGSITHPAYASVTMGLLYGAAPDAMLLVHDVARTETDGYGTPLLSFRHLIRLYEDLCATVKPAKVIGVALNTSSLSDLDAARAIESAAIQTGLPCDDVVRNGPQGLWAAIAPLLKAAGKTSVLKQDGS
jgi:uncharacterized NAD-dependent epimerase/dehydratase family protein